MTIALKMDLLAPHLFYIYIRSECTVVLSVMNGGFYYVVACRTFRSSFKTSTCDIVEV